MPNHTNLGHSDISNLVFSAQVIKNPKFANLLKQYDSLPASIVCYKISNETLLAVAARGQSENTFITFIDKADADAISQAILSQSDDKWTPLHVAARYQTENAFIALINKTTTDAINHAVQLQNDKNLTPLHMAARQQSSAGFIALVNKIDVSILNKITLLQTDIQWNLLHLAARLQAESGLTTLINKIDINVLNQSIPLKTCNGWTLLHLVARHQSEKIFITLVEKIDVSLLQETINLKNNDQKTYFNYLLEFQSYNSIFAIIKKISNKALNDCLLSLDDKSLTMLFEKMFTSADLTNAVMAKLTDHTAAYLLKSLNQYPRNGACLTQILFLEKILNGKFNNKQSCKTDTFKTSKGNNISFSDPKLVDIILQEGFYSYDDVASLVSNCKPADRHAIFDIIKELDTFDLLLKGGLTQYQAPPALPETMQQKIEKFEILYKMIKPEFFDNYLAQFKDYTVRPNDIRNKKPNATYKFHHLTGEIKPYQSKGKHNCNKQAIKKNSTTLLSPELITPVFGEQHQDGRPLVGLLFDFNQCTIKAMLKYDIGTVNRGWVGSAQDVENYRSSSVNLNYTDLTQFRQAIQHSTRLNEVLAEIPKEAILGVFMRDTRLKSKQTALDYANKIKATLGLDLPIYHYSSVDRAVLPYPKERIEQHVAFGPIKAAQNLRNSLLHSSYDLLFWGGETYTSPDGSLKKRLPKTAYHIITKLDTLLAEKNIDKINQALDNIETLLATKLYGSPKRTPTTVNSYKANFTQLKNR